VVVAEPNHDQGAEDQDPHDDVEDNLRPESFGLFGLGGFHLDRDMKTQHWLVKQEPESYSWDDFVRDGRTAWEGVRNYQARNNLKAMQAGDRVLFYASGESKAVIGIAEVTKAAFPDKTADEPGWVAVELKAVRPLPHPVTLAQVKAEPALSEILLVRHTRLSVMPLPTEAFERIVRLGA
jgi:predicted RNA-binding protein with PUA-like domain